MNNNENHQSLRGLIQPHIDKSFEELPEELSRMVEAVFSGLWNKMDAKYQYEFAVKRDYDNDPANEEEIKYRRNLSSEINKVRREIGKWELMRHQNDPVKAKIQDEKLTELRAKLSELSELLEKPWERPPNLQSDAAKVVATKRGITKNQVIDAFAGLHFDGHNGWRNALSDVPQWIEPCRVTLGRKGDNSISATWNPVLIAVALIDKGITAKQLDAVFFHSQHDWADEWADEWAEASANDR